MFKKILPVITILSLVILASGQKGEKIRPERSSDKAVLVIMRFVDYPMAKEAMI